MLPGVGTCFGSLDAAFGSEMCASLLFQAFCHVKELRQTSLGRFLKVFFQDFRAFGVDLQL